MHLQDVAVDLVEDGVRLTAVEPAHERRVSIIAAAPPWHPNVAKLKTLGCRCVPTYPLRTRRVGHPRKVLAVEPVQLALRNGLPELGRRRLNKVPDMSVRSIIGYLKQRASEGQLQVVEQCDMWLT